ncbi:uncharacterized protein LOC115405926 [Salarias fasciatus]|uniref:uncharacterized protein LOC115405926 n=1 Tax=Salarias fasciatus TaxID=181472 RepID=UPI001176F158|nr:uncharacterized protein LOC115405926 [Salarias fasciatus]
MASVARDICPFPNYNPSPHFINMLSINSSHHLRNHYAAVQSSLTPTQLEEFSQSLRTTFGREGRVTLGGVGVVALSLAILFDTLAKQVKGEFVPDSGPIPNLFLKNPGGYYPPNVFRASNYLRLVPYIANNPERMRAETERYFEPIDDDRESEEGFETHKDITKVNEVVGYLIFEHVKNHLLRIIKSKQLDEMESGGHKEMKENAATQGNSTETAHGGKSRKRRIASPDDPTFTLNCDPEAASKIFLTEVLKSNDTQEAYENCQDRLGTSRTWLHYIAGELLTDFFLREASGFGRKADALRAQREDFDLRANSLLKWKE